MPDRIIRDEVLRSHRFVGLSSDTLRLVFIALVLSADDLGNTEATSTAIGIMLVRSVSEEVAAKWLAELADVDLIRVYASGRKRYAHIPRFRQRLRYSSGKHPRPPENIECKEIKDLAQKVRPRTDYGLTADGLKTAEVKRSEEKNYLAQSPDGFARFWASYPRKRDKRQAEKTWKALKPDASLQAEILAALEIQKQDAEWLKENGQFIPYPSTWLSGRRWEDELATAKPKGVAL